MVFMADIEAMFHQVHVPEKERNLFSYLWWEDINLQNYIDYKMCLYMCLVGYHPLNVVIMLYKEQLWIMFQVTVKQATNQPSHKFSCGWCAKISNISKRCSNTNPGSYRSVQKWWIQADKIHKQQERCIVLDSWCTQKGWCKRQSFNW